MGNKSLDIDIFIQRNRDRMDKDTLIGVLADKFNLDYEEARKEVMRKVNMKEASRRPTKDMINQYLATALWSSMDIDTGDPLDDTYTFNDFDRDSIRKAEKDLSLFLKEAEGMLDDVDDEEVGHNFWLSRNGHGAGFFDSDFEYADELQDIARGFGETAVLSSGDEVTLYESEGVVSNKQNIKEKAKPIDIGYGQLVGKSQKEILPESVMKEFIDFDEDDAFIASNGWVYNVSVEGKHIGEFVDIEDAERALKRWIKRNNFYPSIWFVDDHGGVEPYILEQKNRKQDNTIIEVQAPFKVGNALIEKGDKIRVIQEEKFRGENAYRFQDEIAAKEIELFLENDADLYRQQFMPIIENIKRKMKSGRYDHSLAPKLWMYFVDNGVKKYIKEYGTPGDRIDSILIKKDRMTLAQKLADYYYDQIVDGEYGDI